MHIKNISYLTYTSSQGEFMDTFEAIHTRRSVRKYKNEKVSKEKIQKIRKQQGKVKRNNCKMR